MKQERILIAIITGLSISFIIFIWFTGIVDTSLNPFMRDTTQFEGTWTSNNVNSEFLGGNLTFNFYTDEQGSYRAFFSSDGTNSWYDVHGRCLELGISNSIRFEYKFFNDGHVLGLKEEYTDQITIYTRTGAEDISWSPHFNMIHVILNSFCFVGLILIFVIILVLRLYEKSKKENRP